MAIRSPGSSQKLDAAIERIIGYLNFSSGAPDPQILAAWDEVFQSCPDAVPPWQAACGAIRDGVTRVAGKSSAFADVTQARAVLALVQDTVIPAYLSFHADLLFHQDPAELLRPFFLGRVCEAVLSEAPPWDDVERIRDGAVHQLNDFIGYRPVPTLETHRHEPYPHEWVRPVPIFVRDAGVERGKYCPVLTQALEILRTTDSDILEMAQFDPDMLDELAYDPRAYDFDHPVNKRPNYQFGQWDPHHIDQRGYYRRFVVQQMTLDGLLSRVAMEHGSSRAVRMFEASAALAGTILMGAGICGRGPGAHDSEVTLTALLRTVARYRDEFYARLLARAPEQFQHHLQRQAQHHHQPFGGSRKHLNAYLARLRAGQLQHMQLAKIFAKMGHTDAAARQTTVIPAASARLLCQIDCQLAAGEQHVRASRLAEAQGAVENVLDLTHRGIQCGAIVDPWNILGFDAHFSLFPALENSVYDHRIDQLVDVMEELFVLCSRIWSAAAADNNEPIARSVAKRFEETATWWHQFAAHEVSMVDAENGQEILQAARNVATVLGSWYQGGAASGDVKFWGPHAHMFTSPKAFAFVIEALLERNDHVAAMALLIQWLSQADQIELQSGNSTFHDLTLRWLLTLLQQAEDHPTATDPSQTPRRLVRKFFDYLEANAELYWHAPSFHLQSSASDGESRASNTAETGLFDDAGDGYAADEDEDLFNAAYEGVVYRDSTDDGIDSELFDFGESTNDELFNETRRIVDRLLFLSTLARLWRLTALRGLLCAPADDRSQQGDADDCIATMRHWVHQALRNYNQLLALIQSVQDYAIPRVGTDSESLSEYDRQRSTRDSLLEHIVTTAVDTLMSARSVLAAILVHDPTACDHAGLASDVCDAETSSTARVMAAVLRRDDVALQQAIDQHADLLSSETILYVPVSKGGDARKMVAARCRQQSLRELLSWLPRLGKWVETCDLIELARCIEGENVVGPSAVTEFDTLFKAGFRGLVESLVASAATWQGTDKDRRLVQSLEELTEILLGEWLDHSRTLRLSVLETVDSSRKWKRVVEFIQRYGGDLFSQHLLQFATLRAILQQGVDHWLSQLESDPDRVDRHLLLRELDEQIDRGEAAELLTLIFEALCENYGEYRDYNGTTTQSDRGEMLYCLIDFLRLRTRYDRVSWHLKPVIMAHEILVRRGHDEAAGLWRRTLSERIDQEAEQFLVRLHRLEKKHAMRMSTIADRLAERFVRPMMIGRLCALVEPAIQDAGQGDDSAAFQQLERETEQLAAEATGIGFDLPVWLLQLDEEVQRFRRVAHLQNYDRAVLEAIPHVPLAYDDVATLLEDCAYEDDDETPS